MNIDNFQLLIINSNHMIKKTLILTAIMLMTSLLHVSAEVDPNFHIYLCFGQSNMEGNAQWESIDNSYVDPRFQMLATCNFSNPSRSMGRWYTAKCPIVSPDGRLGPTDYFGRTMVAAMPTDVKIGVIAVAMGGSPIEMFDKDKYQQKMSQNPNEWWVTLAKRHYGGNPYGRLIEMGKKAQEVGVIKGILLHQGCSNCNDSNWPNMVNKIYKDMLNDLGLNAEDVPLFVGEVEYENMGGGCSSHNQQVARIPSVIPTGHVVKANQLPGNGQDPWHFSASGYRIFGRRYAFEVLKTMGIATQKNPDYEMPSNLKKFFGVTRLYGADVTINIGKSKRPVVKATFGDGHTEDVSADVTFSSDDFEVSKVGALKSSVAKKGIVKATFTDFCGDVHTADINVEFVDPAGIEAIEGSGDGSQEAGAGKVFTLDGRRVDANHLRPDIYIKNGKKVVVK